MCTWYPSKLPGSPVWSPTSPIASILSYVRFWLAWTVQRRARKGAAPARYTGLFLSDSHLERNNEVTPSLASVTLTSQQLSRGLFKVHHRELPPAGPWPHLLFSSLKAEICLQTQQHFWVPWPYACVALSTKAFCLLKVALSFNFCSSTRFNTFGNGLLVSLCANQRPTLSEKCIQQKCMS